MSEQNPDVLCITETWIYPRVSFEFSGFITVSADRSEQRSGGGVLLLIRKEISFGIEPDVRCELITHEVDLISVTINTIRSDVVVLRSSPHRSLRAA